MKEIKAIYIGLDGILIDTISGDSKPRGIWDMKFRFDVLHTIKTLNPEIVLIVDSLDNSTTDSNNKLNYILSAIRDYLDGIRVYYWCTNAKDEYSRCTIELLEFYNRFIFNDKKLKKSELLMVGNSKIHKQVAKDYGIIYLNVELFVQYDISSDSITYTGVSDSKLSHNLL